MFESKSLARIIVETINRVSQTTGIESVEPGTVLRQLIEQQQLQVYELQRFVQLLTSATFLSEQSGPFLDTIASLFGLKRNPQQVVQKIGGIRFQTNDGSTIGSKLSPTFFVDNDVYVYDRHGGSYIVDKVEVPDYKLRYGYITVNQTPIEVAVAELAKGDVTTYKPEVAGVSVTNVSAIQLIQPAESDSELRYRIQQHLNSYRMQTAHQIRLQQMSVPGVQDQKIIEYPRGVGSIDIYILGMDMNTDEQLIQPVTEQVARFVQAGIDFKVKTFNKTHIILGGTVIAKRRGFENELLNSIQAVQRQYIDSIEPGGSLNKHALLGHIIRSCPDVESIDGFVVYTKQPFGMQIAKPLMRDSYKCDATEKLMLQPVNWHVFKVI